MFYDPFDTFIDYQLRSVEGRAEERLTLRLIHREDWEKLGIPPGTMARNRGEIMEVHEKGGRDFENWENEAIAAYDKKYHSPELWEGKRGKIFNLQEQGFTQMQIAGIVGVSQPRVNKILKRGYKNPNKA